MIKAFAIRNFMLHSEVDFQGVPMVNVLVGKNDTGKTGLLKLLYASAKALEVYSLKGREKTVFKNELNEKLYDTFMPSKKGLGELVQKGSKDKMEVSLDFASDAAKYAQNISYSFGDRTEKQILTCTEAVEIAPTESFKSLFIPAKEVLTAFADIRNIRDNFYGNGFDDTYLDLIKALSLPTTKGRVVKELHSVNKALEELFEGKIEQTQQNDQPFLFKKGNQQFAMQQTAEGIKKIGILTTLINNRQLGRGTMLFIDEPETALHPDAIRQMVEMLVAMSKAGVQIFIATHSYFVIKQLAICAMRDALDAVCWSLAKNGDRKVDISFHLLKEGILPENSIIDEALRMYDQEISIHLNA